MTLALLLIQIAVILAVCLLVRASMRRLGQPPVVGEMIAGLLLGPSFFGWFANSWYQQLFPAASLPALHGLSQVGLVLFMFLIGLRFDMSELTAFRHVAGLAGILSIVVPFGAGLLLARALYPLAPPSTPMLPFSLFVAVSMSITAFPVLARILRDHGLESTRLGHIAVACAAFNDVAAWSMLAWIISMTHLSDGELLWLRPLTTVIVYFVMMLGPVRIVLRIISKRFQTFRELPALLVFLFLSSWITEIAGLHALFGAFVAGLVWPRNAATIEDLSSKMEPLAMAVLLPLFFSYTGIRTNIGLVQGATLWWLECAIVAIAILAKAGGAFAGAMIVGYGVRDSLALGTLLNARGLVELVVLNIGLDLGILSPVLFSMMVLMALATTLMTSPVLTFLQGGRPFEVPNVSPAHGPSTHLPAHPNIESRTE